MAGVVKPFRMFEILILRYLAVIECIRSCVTTMRILYIVSIIINYQQSTNQPRKYCLD